MGQFGVSLKLVRDITKLGVTEKIHKAAFVFQKLDITYTLYTMMLSVAVNLLAVLHIEYVVCL